MDEIASRPLRTVGIRIKGQRITLRRYSGDSGKAEEKTVESEPRERVTFKTKKGISVLVRSLAT
jgi:hypothetical protein